MTTEKLEKAMKREIDKLQKNLDGRKENFRAMYENGNENDIFYEDKLISILLDIKRYKTKINEISEILDYMQD